MHAQLICLECNDSMFVHKTCTDHCSMKHRDQSVEDKMCHYEMNLMKAFMGLYRNVFMSELTNQMGWISESAQQAVLNCYDNHKTWHLITIFNFGSLIELVHPYVISCITVIKGLIFRGRNLPPGLSLPKSPAQQVAGAYPAWRNPRSGQRCGAVRSPPGCDQTSMPGPLPSAISKT